ncbi:BLUF domain-containing protein [Arcobacter arenosus]|uniref:BLUF domain-containing protein n=1 Tax=Arcobacter arenosus TaxID=2576037 RepID=A0A5R8XZF2_9BACT|nr:BLUF domain-containing protein [Arcobacter arenosus]TLP36977.1 BLUF domain-containing protein [Arcobacter arenosus]
MYRILYTSSATKNLDDKELEEILEKSRINNQKKDVTGLLIVKGRTFLQCLEGEKDDVLSIYEKISNDERHTNIIDLFEEDIDERLFPQWSMGYKNIKHLSDIKSEKLKSFNTTEEFEESKDDILDIFKEFIEAN